MTFKIAVVRGGSAFHDSPASKSFEQEGMSIQTSPSTAALPISDGSPRKREY
jgi:hypothetical protein